MSAVEQEGDALVVRIDLGNTFVAHGEDAVTFGEHVAVLAARELLRGDRDLVGEFRRRAAKIADDEIREAFRPLIEEALTQAVQPTDGFGTPKGPAKTLREVLVEHATAELRQKRDRGGIGRKQQTLVEEFVAQEVDSVLRRELQEAVKEAKAEVLVAVREQAATVISETIERVAAGRA